MTTPALRLHEGVSGQPEQGVFTDTLNVTVVSELDGAVVARKLERHQLDRSYYWGTKRR